MSIKRFLARLVEKITGRKCSRCRYNCAGRCCHPDGRMFMRCWHGITRPGYKDRPAPRKPLIFDHDHEDYFTASLRCPFCQTFLASYTYGRAWTDNGLSKEKMIDCPDCGQRIDWSGVKQKVEERLESADLTQEELYELEKIVTSLQEASATAKDAGLLED